MSGVQVPSSLKQLTQLAECLAYNEKVSGSSPLLFKLGSHYISVCYGYFLKYLSRFTLRNSWVL